MRILNRFIVLILFLSITIFAGDVGTITGLNGEATIQRDGASIKATVGAKLEQKDIIKTKDNSKLQIIFKDETIITLGKNSDFSVEEYLFEDSKEPVAKFGMLKGAMRTITGKIGKIAPQKFIVKTKTTTIGIRGTNFAVVVGEDGSYQAYCTYGAISVTINGEVYIIKQGFLISISPIGEIEIIEFTPKDLKDMQKKNFNGDHERKGNANNGKSIEVVQGEENNEQLDVTITDENTIILQNITDNNSEIIQNNITGIENYIMNDALYSGNYTVTATGSGGTGLATNGTAELEIDFGADIATLTLDGTAVFDYNPTFNGNSFNIGQSGVNTGSADGTFQDETGNHVMGNFKNGDNMYWDSGTYDVTSSQTLH